MTSPTAPNLARIPAGDFLMGAADAEAGRTAGPSRLRQRILHRPLSGHAGRLREFLVATGQPAPHRRTSPADCRRRSRHDCFARLAAPYVWEQNQPPAGHGTHPVVLVRYDDALSRTANGCRMRSHARSGCRVKRNGRRRRGAASKDNATRGATTSTRRDVIFSTDAAVRSASAARGRAGCIRRMRTVCTTCVATCGNGCRDWHSAEFYGRRRHPRSVRSRSGQLRIVRGGSWVNDDVSMLRCAYRHKVPPDTYAYSVGFRVVCEP